MFEDAEEVIKAVVMSKRRWCAFTLWSRTLTPEQATKAEALVDNREYDCRSLARYFQSKGGNFNDQVVSRHRNRRCCRRSG